MSAWSNTAFLFPGQGSQYVGMACDVIERYPAARLVFEKADDILNYSLSDIILNGPEDTLNQTDHTQPALYIASLAILAVLQDSMSEITAAFAAGHSLGEITALTAAGSLEFEEGLLLVRTRGQLMAEAGEKRPGMMAAILGLESEQVQQICQAITRDTGHIVVLANDNCPGQIVISGEPQGVEIAIQKLSEAGARRALPLAVSIAAHSPLMASVEHQYKEAVAAIPFKAPKMRLYANTTALPMEQPDAIQQELSNQLTGPVLWTGTVQNLMAAGAETFIEVGPKNVLTGLLKRIDRTKEGISIDTVAAIESFLTRYA